MIALLLKASIISAILLAFYKIFLEKESFFATNRIYLIGCIILTFTLPFISLPPLVSEQGLVATLIEEYTGNEESPLPQLAVEQKEVPGIIETKDKHREPLSLEQEAVSIPSDNINTETESLNKNLEVTNNSVKEEKGIGYWISLIYLFGVVIFFLNFIVQIGSVLLKVIKSTDKVHDTNGIIINTPFVQEPCSFFNYIFINPESYDFDTYEQIIAHEKIHVKKWHTLDLLLSEMAIILLWFNPLIWSFRKEVEKNIEYQTDDFLLNGAKVKKDQYQMNLLKVATYSKPLTITTNYNQSLIKQRILKMSAKKSNPQSFWKYAFLAPLIFTILLIINKPYSIMAQTGNEKSSNLNEDSNDMEVSKFLENFENLKDEEKLKVLKALKGMKKFDDLEDVEAFENLKDEEKMEVFKDLVDEENFEEKSDTLKDPRKFEDLSDTEKKEILDILNGKVDEEKKDDLNVEINTGDLNSRDKSEILDAVESLKHIKNDEKVRNFEDMDDDEKSETIDILNGTVDEEEVDDLNISIKLGNLEGEDKEEVLKALKDVKGFESRSGSRKTDDDDSNDCQQLLDAVKGEELSKVKQLLKSTDPNCSCKDNLAIRTTIAYPRYSPLLSAARSGNLELGKLLVKANADVNFNPPGAETPLMAAAQVGALDLVKHLVDNGAVVNKKVSGKGTGLMLASMNGHMETVKYLLSKGADVNANVSGKGTAIILASRNGQHETVKYLHAKGANINTKASGVGTPLTVAAEDGNLEALKNLLSIGAGIEVSVSGDGTALIVAANKGHLEIVKYLISQRANINAKASGEGTPLSVAAREGHTEIVKYLLSKGANIDKRASGVSTALVQSIQKGHHEIAKILLDNGADMNVTSGGEKSAMYHAEKSQDKAMIDLLKKY